MVYRIVTKHRGSVSVAARTRAEPCSGDLPTGRLIRASNPADHPHRCRRRHPLGILGLGAINVSVERLTRKAADGQARSADQMAARLTCGCSFRSFRLRTKSMHSSSPS